MPGKITIEDISARLGLSQATVSRALNDKYGVSEQTRKKVLLCAYELGYDFSDLHNITKPSAQADCVCVVMQQSDLLERSFYGDVLYGVETYLKEQRFSLCLSFITSDQQARVLLDSNRFKPDGYIIMGRIPLNAIVDIYARGTPIVLLDPYYTDHKVCRVELTNTKGGAEAAEHLIRCGHKHVAFVGNPSYSNNFASRCQGFCDRIRQEKDIRLWPVTGEKSDSTVNDQAIITLLQSKDRPTAIFCGNDQVAFRVYEIARQMGLRIPQDLSVVGFDDMERCQWMVPAMSSVSVPKAEFGRTAAQLLLQNIADPQLAVRSVKLETGFADRESVAVIDSYLNRAEIPQG